jgi:hypothetical protein
MQVNTTQEQFEELEAELHQAVGRMVATWSQVEGWLAHILTLLLIGNARGRQGETIYYEVPNLRPRMAMVKAAFFNRSEIAQTTRETWDKILDAIEREAPERNSIIHGDFIRGNPTSMQIAVGVSPRIFSDMRRQSPPPGVWKLGFDAGDINRHIERIGNLRDALWALYGDLPNANDSRPSQSAENYLDAWRVARGCREWPSLR